MPNRFFIDWVDEDGERARSSWWTNQNDVAQAAGMITALMELSYASLIRYGILRTDTPDVAILPVVGGAYDMADKGVLEFLDANGYPYKFAFPCPKEFLLPNSDDIDIDLQVVQDLRDAIQGIIKTRGGEDIGALVRGYRIRTVRS